MHSGFFQTYEIIIFAKFFSLRKHEINDIITACKTHNPIAQEKLYKHYFALMYSICKKYSDNQQTILGLINEGFLKIFLNIQSFDNSKGNFESWAKKIITNTAIDYARQRNKNLIIELKEEEKPEKYLQHDPQNNVEEEVLYLIKSMPAVTQKVFSLHIFKGYSHKEIAAMLDIPEGTSRWHVSEARKTLKQQADKIY